MADHPFATYLRILGKGPKTRRALTQDEAQAALGMILDGQVTEKQLGAFLLLMRANGETPDELIGFVKGTRQRFGLDSQACPPRLHLDWAAYAGKWRYPPYYLLSLKLLAQAGFGVLLHGDQGQFADRHYAEHFLFALDIPQASSLQQARAMLNEPGTLVYLPLTGFAPALRHILHLKEEIGVRTVFNTAVKLLNPLNAPMAVQGIFHKGVEQLHLQTAQALGYANFVFKGEGGEAEMRPDALSHVYAWRKGELVETTHNALIPRQERPDNWTLEELLALWQDKRQDTYGEGAVIATACVALQGLKNLDYASALNEAQQLWQNRHVAV